MRNKKIFVLKIVWRRSIASLHRLTQAVQRANLKRTAGDLTWVNKYFLKLVGEYWLPIGCRRLKMKNVDGINKFLSHVNRLNIHAKQLGLSPKCNQKKSQTCHAGIKSFQIFIDFTKRNCQSNTMKFAKMSDFIFQQCRNFFSMSIKSNFAKWFKVRQIWSTIKIFLSLWHTNHFLN